MAQFRFGRSAGRFSVGRAGALACAVLLLLGQTACHHVKQSDDVDNLSVEALYNLAVDMMVQKHYSRAAELFDKVDANYPYSVWATKAELMEGFANYQNSDYDAAVAALDNFVALHPGNRDTPYAYYLKAICYYEQITDIGRDQQATQDAQKALQDVINRFPDTEYARDARIKLSLTRDHLAGKEMEIGRYYERHGLYIAAIGRYKNVVDNYQTTTHVPEALARLVESYIAVGLPDEARKNAAVLGYNYPDSSWYADSYSLLVHNHLVTADVVGKDPWYKRIFY
jgi:outer membrane protein assembly factor BamD